MIDTQYFKCDNDKNEINEKEHDHLPKCINIMPGSGSYQQRRVPAKKDPGGHRSQDARGMQAFGWQISDEWSDQRNCDLDWGIVEMALYPAYHHTHKQPESDASSRCPDKAGGRITGRESRGNERPNREL